MSKNKADICFLCECAPCECNKKAPKKPKSKPQIKAETSAKSESTTTPVGKNNTRRSFLEAMKAELPPKQDSQQLSNEEIVLHEAIRNLAPILRGDELERYSAIINAEPLPDSVVWKARRTAQVNS